MMWRFLGWCGIAAMVVAVSWLWPRIGHAPSDFEIAAEYLDNRQPDLALLFFRDASWRGVAAYRAGRYAQALHEFTAGDTVPNLYNAGNSHAQLRDWPNAIATYQRVLRFDPNHADARHNLALVQKLLEPQDGPPESEDEAPEFAPPEVEEHQVTEPQEGLSERAQPADAPQSDTAGNTNDTDEVSDSEAAQRPKPVDTIGEVGTAAAIGRTSDDRGEVDHRVVGSVDLKPRTSARPPRVLLRRIHDDPETVLRARLLAAYESRMAGLLE